MKWQTFKAIVGPSMTPARAKQLINGLNEALILAGCTTVERVAMFIAQTCEESDYYRASSEYASGAEYNWRSDLGNTHEGDGERFKGHSFIQVTGRYNYGYFSQWAHRKGLVNSDTYFVDHPDELSQDQYVWDGPVWYWGGDHNHGYTSLNAAADARDIYSATLMVNGGLNGYDTRKYFWQRALNYGTAILPEVNVPMLGSLKLLRAVVIGGRYATPQLRKQHPRLIHKDGLLTLVHAQAAEMETLKQDVATLKAAAAASAKENKA